MKNTTWTAILLAALGCAFLFVTQPARAQAAAVEPATTAAPAQTPPAQEGVAQAAMKKAAEAHKYLFLFVSENNGQETVAARSAVEAAVTKIAEKADMVSIVRNTAAEKATVEQFQLNRAPMPIVLAIAPNGAITGAYYGDRLKDPQLQESIASEAEQVCMKTLQDGNLVLVCAQNGTTQSNEAAMQGVNDFKADSRFAKFTEIVKIDPASAAEQSFVAKLQIDPKTTEAVTILLAPPSSLVTKVNGATNRDALAADLIAATSGGCGAGGCGPRGCSPTK